MTLVQIYTAAIIILILIGYVLAFMQMLVVVGEPSAFWKHYAVLTVAMFVIVVLVVLVAKWVH